MDSILGDVRDLSRLQKAMADSRAEIVLHLAAQSLVRTSYENPIETYEINVMGTANLLEAARRQTESAPSSSLPATSATRTGNGSGATAKMRRWEATILTPAAKAAQN